MNWQINFYHQNVCVSRSPINVASFEARIQMLLHLSPEILWRSVIYQKNINVITGMVRTKSCSYPQIIAQVAYLVSTLFDETTQSFELVWIYVFQNPTILKLLIEFLTNLEVNNPKERDEAIMGLRELLWSITST